MSSVAAIAIAQAMMCVKETLRPASFNCLRRASIVPTDRLRKLVAVGTDRLSSMYLASIAAPPLSCVSEAVPPAGAAPPPWAAEMMSSLTILPARPLPATAATSTPRSAAARLATGEIDVPSGTETAPLPAPLEVVAVAAAESAAPLESGAGAAATSPPSPRVISAITWPTFTVSPSSARILVTVPVAGDGTSASTLSVEISTIVSSTFMGSPSDRCHSRIVPSVTDSPISGMTTSMVVSTDMVQNTTASADRR